MGTITRHAGAPFASGETSSAADLEADISTFYKEFNGKISSANVLSTANINGSKIQPSSIAEAKIALTTNRIGPKQLARMAYVQTSATADVTTTSTSFVDVPSIQAITVRPYAAADILWIRFSATVNTGTYVWGFSLDGGDTNTLGFSTGDTTMTCAHVRTVPSTSPVTILPRYAALSGGGSNFTVGMQANKVFTVVLLPG